MRYDLGYVRVVPVHAIDWCKCCFAGGPTKSALAIITVLAFTIDWHSSNYHRWVPTHPPVIIIHRYKVVTGGCAGR